MNNKKWIVGILVVIVVAGLLWLIFAGKNTPQTATSTPSSTTNVTTTTGAPTSTISLPQSYSNTAEGFSISYPTNWTVDRNYTYQELGVGKSIAGIKFTIDPAIATGTNLSADTYLSVEYIPKTRACTADLFLDPATLTMQPHTITDDGVTYSVAMGGDAAAGNRYEETVYAVSSTNPCIAVRYFVHYGVLENYPSGTVMQYNTSTLQAQFDAIRHTLIINQ